MDEETEDLVALIYAAIAPKIGHAWPKALFKEAAQHLEKLHSELIIKESVQQALEKTIHDERAENSTKTGEIVRLRSSLELITKSDADQAHDLANLALDNVDV